MHHTYINQKRQHITAYVTEGCQKKMKESLGELFDKQVQIPSITYSLIKNDDVVCVCNGV